MNQKTTQTISSKDYITVDDLFGLFETWKVGVSNSYIPRNTFGTIINKEFTVKRQQIGPGVGPFKPRLVAVIYRKYT